MKRHVCSSWLIVLFIALAAQSALARTKVRQGPYKSPLTNERSCRWTMNQRNGVPLIRRFLARCMCRHKRTSIAFIVRNSLPSKSACLRICLLDIRLYSCNPRLISEIPRHFIARCCTKCGGALLQRKAATRIFACSPKAVQSSSPSRAAPMETRSTNEGLSTLTAVEDLFSPAYNTKVLQINILIILNSVPVSNSLTGNISVSGNSFTSRSIFIALNRGWHSSPTEISALKHPVPRHYLLSLLSSNNRLAHGKASNFVNVQIECQAEKCGAVVAVHAKKSIKAQAIRLAIKRLKEKTPNFDSVFGESGSLIREVKGGRFIVFIPFKQTYIQNLLRTY